MEVLDTCYLYDGRYSFTSARIDALLYNIISKSSSPISWLLIAFHLLVT